MIQQALAVLLLLTYLRESLLEVENLLLSRRAPRQIPSHGRL